MNTKKIVISFIINASLVLGFLSFAQAETAKNTLIIALESKPKSLDPRFIGTDEISQYLEELRFLPLISFDENRNIKNILIDNYSQVGDKIWKIKLRKGVKFYNGKELTSTDVTDTYNRIISEDTVVPSPRNKNLQSILKIEKLDKYHVMFHLKKQDNSFITKLTIGIIPSESIGMDSSKLVNLESGPFLLSEHTGEEVVLTRNEKFNYKIIDLHKPNLEKVVFKIIADSSLRYAELLNGKIDLIQNIIDADKVMEIRQNRISHVKAEVKTSSNAIFLAFNLKDKLFSNNQVRKALSKAINRDEILQFVANGLGVQVPGILPNNLIGTESVKGGAYDLEGTKKLLNEAGFQTNSKTPIGQFTIKVPSYSKDNIMVAKAIAGQLNRINFDVSVEILDIDTFTTQLINGNTSSWLVEKKLPLHNIVLDKSAEEISEIYLWHKLNFIVHRDSVSNYKIYADGRLWSLLEVQKN